MSIKCKFVSTPPCKKWAFHAGFCKDHQTSVVVSTKIHAKENLFVNAPWRCFFCNNEHNGVDYCPSCTQLYKSLGDDTHMITRDMCSVVPRHLMWETTHVVLRGKRTRTLYEEAMAVWEPPEVTAAATPTDSKEMKRTTPYLTAALEYIESGATSDKPLLFNAINRQEVVRHYIGKVMYTFMIPDLIHIISTYASATDIIKANEWVDVGIDETLLWPLDLSTLDNQGNPSPVSMAHTAATVAATTGHRPLTTAALMGVPPHIVAAVAHVPPLPPAPGPGGMLRIPPAPGPGGMLRSAPATATGGMFQILRRPQPVRKGSIHNGGIEPSPAQMVDDGGAEGETKRRGSITTSEEVAADLADMAAAAANADLPAAPAFVPPPSDEEIGAPPPDAPPMTNNGGEHGSGIPDAPPITVLTPPFTGSGGMAGSNHASYHRYVTGMRGSIPVRPAVDAAGRAIAARTGMLTALRRPTTTTSSNADDDGGMERTSVSVFPLLDEQGALKVSSSSASSSAASVAAAAAASSAAAVAAAAVTPLACRWRPGRVIKIDGLRVLVGVKMDRWWRQCRPNSGHPYTTIWVHLLDTARIRSVAAGVAARRRPWNFIPYFDYGAYPYDASGLRRPMATSGEENYDVADADFEQLPYDPARKRAGQLGLYYGGIEHDPRHGHYDPWH